ncbi:hypothetical protein [Desulfocurvus sp. DL9XJH121]
MNLEASQAPGDGHGEETPSHWLEQAIPEDAVLDLDGGSVPLRGHPQLAKYATVADMAKSLLHAQSLVGRKAVGLVRPGDQATDEERAAFDVELRRMLDVPEGPEGYDLAAPENADGQMLGWFRDAAHEAGLSPDQARGLSEGYDAFMRRAAGQWREEREAQRNETLRELGRRWGGDAGANMEHARRGFLTCAENAGLSQTQREALLAAHGDDPVLIRLFHGVGTALAEDDFVDGAAGPRARSEISPERFFAEEVFGGKGE